MLVRRQYPVRHKSALAIYEARVRNLRKAHCVKKDMEIDEHRLGVGRRIHYAY